MEWLVQYSSLGFDQRQEKARKPRVRQLGAGIRTGGGGWEWGWVKKRGERRGKVPIWQSGLYVNNSHLNKKDAEFV